MVRSADTDLTARIVTNPYEADVTIRAVASAPDFKIQTVTERADIRARIVTVGGDATYVAMGSNVEVTAGAVDDGTAPLLASFGLTPVTAVGGQQDAAGWSESLDSPANDIWAWRYPVVSPGAGSTLVGWGMDTTTAVDGGQTGGQLNTTLAAPGPAGVPGTDDVTGDGTSAAVAVPGTTGCFLQWNDGETVSTSFVSTLTTPVVDPADYYIEQGFAHEDGPVNESDDLTFGRLYTIWSV